MDTRATAPTAVSIPFFFERESRREISTEGEKTHLSLSLSMIFLSFSGRHGGMPPQYNNSNNDNNNNSNNNNNNSNNDSNPNLPHGHEY